MRNFILTVAVILHSSLFAQQAKIQGKVVNDEQLPLAGAEVRLLNSHSRTYTDSLGRFELPRFAGMDRFLISLGGYAARVLSASEISGEALVVVLSPVHRQLDEVVVTASKSESLQQQLPGAISVLSGRRVAQLQLWNSRELTAIIPTMYAANPGDGRNVISLRGITSSSYEPAVATYVDGVNQFNLDTYIGELLDIQRIEVLRGPQAALYGRNAMGGVLNIITKPAGGKISAFAELTGGNHGYRRIAAGANIPVLSDKLQLRLAAVHNARDGFYHNTYNDSSYDNLRSDMINLSLGWAINQRLAVNLNLKQQFNRNDGAFPLVFGTEEAFKSPFILSQNATARMNDDIFNGSVDVSYVGTAFNFRSISTWQSNYRYYDRALDADFSPMDGISIFNNYGNDWNKVGVATQEFRFSSPASAAKLQWLAGGYLFHQKSPVKQAMVFGRDATMFGSPDSLFSIINTSTTKSNGLSLFGQVSVPLASAWKLQAGLRFDHENRELAVRSDYEKGFSFPLRTDTSATTGFDVFSPSVSVTYQPGKTATLYVQYNRGYRAGGLTQISADPGQPPLYRYSPEQSDNFEIGTKNEFLNSRVKMNLSVFYIRLNNAQVPVLVLPDAITVVRNAGKMRSRGLESEISARLAGGLMFTQNFGYTHASFSNSKAQLGGREVDLEGRRQVFTPRMTSMTGLGWQHEIRKSWQLLLGLEWYYLGRQYFNLENTIGQGDYHLLTGRAGFAHKKLQLLFWAKNITDTRYIDYAYDFGAVHLGEPFRLGFTFKYQLRQE